MTRGLFDLIASTGAYRGAEKYWHITLDRSEFFWYELVVDPPEFANSKQAIVAYLDRLRDAVKQSLEKRFIYFYLSRRKVRFDARRQPNYSWFGGRLNIHLLIGRDQVPKTISIPMLKRDGKYFRPNVEVDDRFIYFYDANFSSTASIHDFLLHNHISLGLNSEVQYVGITKDPGSRTINREHRGYADTLYFNPTDDNDIFLCVNLFKVMTDASAQDFGIRFVVPNSMTNEIPTDEEGEIIELALINYFNTKPQESDKDRSRARFKNVLAKLRDSNKISSVSIHMEIAEPSEYDVIGSRRVPKGLRHSFLWHLVNGEPTLVQFESEDEISEYRERSKVA